MLNVGGLGGVDKILLDRTVVPNTSLIAWLERLVIFAPFYRKLEKAVLALAGIPKIFLITVVNLSHKVCFSP